MNSISQSGMGTGEHVRAQQAVDTHIHPGNDCVHLGVRKKNIDWPITCSLSEASLCRRNQLVVGLAQAVSCVEPRCARVPL